MLNLIIPLPTLNMKYNYGERNDGIPSNCLVCFFVITNQIFPEYCVWLWWHMLVSDFAYKRPDVHAVGDLKFQAFSMK